MSPARRNASTRTPAIDEVGKELRAPRAAGVAGLLFAILFIGVLVFVRAPAAAPGETLSQWYGSGAARTRIVLMGLYAIPFAGIAFLWFIGVVRDRIGRREDQLFATVFLGSGLLFVAMLFAAAATASAMALRLDMLATEGAVDPGRPAVQPGAHVHVPVRVRGARRRRVHDRHVDDRHPHEAFRAGSGSSATRSRCSSC